MPGREALGQVEGLVVGVDLRYLLELARLDIASIPVDPVCIDVKLGCAVEARLVPSELKICLFDLDERFIWIGDLLWQSSGIERCYLGIWALFLVLRDGEYPEAIF